MKGKSADTFGPIGPWLVTADEVGDPQELRSVAGGGWPEISGWVDRDDGVRGGLPGELFEPVYESAAGGYYFDRDPSGGWAGPEAAGVSAAGQCDSAWGRGTGGAAPDGCTLFVSSSLRVSFVFLHFDGAEGGRDASEEIQRMKIG